MDEKSALLIKKFLPMKNLLLSLAAALCCIATINAQVAITVGGGSWCSEVSWSLTDASGTEVASGTCGDYSVTANDGDCFDLTMNDSYGDGWNGNTFIMGDFSTGLAGGATETENFCYTAPSACADTEYAWSMGGVDTSWIGNAGIVTKSTSEGEILQCSDGLDIPSFTDLVVQISIAPG